MTRQQEWDQQVRMWKAYGIPPELVRRFREAGVLDGQMHHWMELQVSCGYTVDEVVYAAEQLMRMKVRKERGW